VDDKRWSQVAVVGGAGAVGTLFRRKLMAHADYVVCLDRAPPTDGGEYVRIDVERIAETGCAVLAGAELVVWALPEAVTLASLPGVLPLVDKSALLVETLSVQTRVARLLTDSPCQAVGLNPMFAPSLDFAGRGVALIEIRGGPQVERLALLLKSWGSRIVRTAAREHDRAAALVQALTHATVLAFGATLQDCGAELPLLMDLAPPPCRVLLALLARITSSNPEVYWDVQHGNPFAPVAREALKTAAVRFSGLAVDETAFRLLLSRLQSFLGSQGDVLAEECAQMFAATGA